MKTNYIDVVFDGAPDPSEGARFVEIENDEGVSFKAGDWFQRSDGYWILRIPKGVFE